MDPVEPAAVPPIFDLAADRLVGRHSQTRRLRETGAFLLPASIRFPPVADIRMSLGFARHPRRNMARPLSLSLTSFVMEQRLPWGDGSSAAPVGVGRFDQALIIEAGHQRACTIRSVSPLGATLTGEIAARTGEQVSVELVTGQRASSTVEWVEAGEAGVRFKQPIDVVALINRKLISQPAERRSMPRIELRCGLRVTCGGTVRDAVLRNISARGMQLEGDDLPPVGTPVSIEIEGLDVPNGQVMWRKDNLAGIQLVAELSWTSLMPWIRTTSRAGAARTGQGSHFRH